MITRSQSLADQLHNEILNWIQSNWEGDNGGMLPSETSLSEMFSTSRATVREALAQLERERLVIRRQGSGTYVSPAFHKLNNTINELNDPLAMIRRNGSVAEIGKVEYTLSSADKELARLLDINSDEIVVNLRVLYLLDGVPVANLEAVIPAFGQYKETSGLPTFTDLMRFASEVSGSLATYSISSLRSLSATESLANLLQIAVGRPILAMEELYMNDQGSPVFQSTLNILSSKVELDLLRNSDRSVKQIVIW